MFGRSLIPVAGAVAVLYALTVLWYVPTQRSIPLQGLLVNSSPSEYQGLEIRDISQSDVVAGEHPQIGDVIVAAAGQRVRTFADWARVQRSLRSVKVPREALVSDAFDPAEHQGDSDYWVFQRESSGRQIAKIEIRRPGSENIRQVYQYLNPPRTFGVSITLLWFVIQLCVLVVAGVACWNRPAEQSLRTFFALSALSMAAFVGGSHWWIISGSPFLVAVFAISGTLLPATLLHFFLVFPHPAGFYARHPGWCRLGLYGPPAVLALLMTGLIALARGLSLDYGPGPFADTIERLTGNVAVGVFARLRQVIFLTLGIELVYFLLSLFAIRRGLMAARTALERIQVTWIQWAAVFASVPIGCAVYLALTDDVGFALGKARIPMFLASLSFTLAYGVGIARYKLMLIDQVVSRGVWYYLAKFGVALVFAALMAVGLLNLLQQNVQLFSQSVPLVLMIMTSVLVLIWLRDAVQWNLDRRFFREKYQLDKALQRMNRVTANVLRPEAVSESLLNSCREVLHVDEAAIYLRNKSSLEFRLTTATGKARFPLQVVLTPETLAALTENLILQRASHVNSPAQDLLRRLQADVVHALEGQVAVDGLLVLGSRPNFSHHSAEDLAFVSALARTTGVALQCATVQGDVARLNQDLQLKTEKIAEQERQLSVLQTELITTSKHSATPADDDEFQRAGIRGRGAAMTSVLETVKKVAGSNSSVLLRGESGTGKELLARAIHENSPRRHGPLVSVHCGALSPTLLESELFGHVKGAFTDARQDRVGRFQLADGGTLFLDEIGDISPEVQVKLLRVLQERILEPVGGNTPIAVDVRIVAATHRNLEQLIDEGLFREDLFYRLNVISITLPPLRERKEDLYELTLHFLRLACEKMRKPVLRIEEDALRTIQSYHWPGNIRELQNVIERAVVLADGDSIRNIALPHTGVPAALTDTRPRQNPPPFARTRRGTSVPPRPVPLPPSPQRESDRERDELVAALARCEGNKAEAARALGIPRSTLFSRLKKHGIG